MSKANGISEIHIVVAADELHHRLSHGQVPASSVRYRHRDGQVPGSTKPDPDLQEVLAPHVGGER